MFRPQLEMKSNNAFLINDMSDFLIPSWYVGASNKSSAILRLRLYFEVETRSSIVGYRAKISELQYNHSQYAFKYNILMMKLQSTRFELLSGRVLSCTLGRKPYRCVWLTGGGSSGCSTCIGIFKTLLNRSTFIEVRTALTVNLRSRY